MDTPGGPQPMAIVSEAGLYSLILRSRKPEAKAFKRWVTHEVLPSIRKTGSYSLPQLDELEVAERYVLAVKAKRAAEERADRAEFQVLELAPAARAWDELVEGDGDYDVAQAAQILNRDSAIAMGQRKLFDYMAALGWIYRKHGRWTPYQSQVDLGRLLSKPQSHRHHETDGVVIDAPQVRVTVKGVGELHKRLGGRTQFDALISEEVAA